MTGERDKALADAVRAGDIDVARAEIDAGVTINDEIRARLVPDFMEAIESDSGSRITLYLALGVDVNVKDADGWTALHYAACKRGGAKLVGELIGKGASVDVRDGDGRTPLHHAAAARPARDDTVEILLASGANVTAVCNAGHAVLHDACRGGKLWLVKTLIETRGADAGQMNTLNDAQPLHYAASGHQLEVLEYLLGRGIAIDVKDGRGRTALHYAAADGGLDLMRFLLDAGAPVDNQSNDGETALFDAAEAGQADAVRMLLDAGADPAIADHRGSAPRDAANDDRIRALFDAATR